MQPRRWEPTSSSASSGPVVAIMGPYSHFQFPLARPPTHPLLPLLFCLPCRQAQPLLGCFWMAGPSRRCVPSRDVQPNISFFICLALYFCCGVAHVSVQQPCIPPPCRPVFVSSASQHAPKPPSPAPSAPVPPALLAVCDCNLALGAVANRPASIMLAPSPPAQAWCWVQAPLLRSSGESASHAAPCPLPTPPHQPPPKRPWPGQHMCALLQSCDLRFSERERVGHLNLRCR
jgi:hypothetical protein